MLETKFEKEGLQIFLYDMCFLTTSLLLGSSCYFAIFRRHFVCFSLFFHWRDILLIFKIIWCLSKMTSFKCEHLIFFITIFTHRNIKKALDKRERRTTLTLFMVCFCYFLFVMPIALVNIIDDTSTSPKLHLALFCIYWLQYSLNFFIYAARSEQYRKAYWYFLRKVI